jgi:hypothetical protein
MSARNHAQHTWSLREGHSPLHESYSGTMEKEMFGKLMPCVAAIIQLASVAVASAQVSAGSAGAAQQNAAPPSGLNGHGSGLNGHGNDDGKQYKQN